MITDDLNIWLVGANGMLGHEVHEVLEEESIAFIATDLECDITDEDAVGRFTEGKGFTHIINCAAYTAVDRAEDEEERAYQLNASGPKILAEAAREIGAVLIHISTDYVFDGKKESGYLESDPANPISAYGRTKAAGEQFIRETLEEHYIIRTAWLYGRYGRNFVSTMLRLMNEKDEISVVNDQHGSPTYAPDLARFIAHTVKDQPGFGVYHYTNTGTITWYDFARKIYEIGREKELIGTDCLIRPVCSEAYPVKAVRPEYSILLHTKTSNSERFYNSWEVSLKEFFLTDE